MKKFAVLVAAAAGLAWAVARSKADQASPAPSDPWAQASDSV